MMSRHFGRNFVFQQVRTLGDIGPGGEKSQSQKTAFFKFSYAALYALGCADHEYLGPMTIFAAVPEIFNILCKTLTLDISVIRRRSEILKTGSERELKGLSGALSISKIRRPVESLPVFENFKVKVKFFYWLILSGVQC